jgi:hypothetical protein
MPFQGANPSCAQIGSVLGLTAGGRVVLCGSGAACGAPERALCGGGERLAAVEVALWSGGQVCDACMMGGFPGLCDSRGCDERFWVAAVVAHE